MISPWLSGRMKRTVAIRPGLGLMGTLAVFGAVAASAPAEPPAPTSHPALDLPALFADEPQTRAPRWRYARVAGMEFLSCADDGWTAAFIDRTFRLDQRLDEFLPPALRLRQSTPVTFVLYGVTQRPADMREILKDMQRAPRGRESVDYATFADATVRLLPNYRFWDQDEQAVMFLANQDSDSTGTPFVSFNYVRYELENRTPPLPRWFVDGMLALHQISSLETQPIYRPTADSELAGWQLGDTGERDGLRPHNNYISTLTRIPTFMFGDKMRRRLAKDPHWQPAFLPIRELLCGPPPPRGDEPPGLDASGAQGAGERNRRYVQWWSQSALFIHWAFHRGEGAPRDAFWKFVERASTEPVTEAMFKEFFGLSFAAADQALAGYFPNSVEQIQMNHQGSPDTPVVTLRDATPAEVARLKGNLERLEIGYVREKYPALVPRYLAQARQTLHRAYDAGIRDPGLLEVMGLCECDGGDDAAARPFLEAAVQAGAIRPRVYYELARLKYQALRARDAAAKLDARQTSELLDLLRTARAKAPPLSGVYELIASVWLQSTATPTPADLTVLDEGVRLFPADLRLINFSSVLYAAGGYRDDALQLVQHGLQVAPAGPDRTRFLKLQAFLAAHPN